MGIKIEVMKSKVKIPWSDLVPTGYRQCRNCGEMAYCRKHRRGRICEICYRRKKR